MPAMNLPDPIAEALAPLLEHLPPDEAMTRLVCPMAGGTPASIQLVERIISIPAIAAHPPLIAGLWLYVDELDRSHRISQSIDDATGSYWHGIMHRREGDFSNSHYWFRQVGRHPALAHIAPDHDPHRFIDNVEAATRQNQSPPALIALQQKEWTTLFAWCAAQ
jgi:hypothetical protein